VPHLPVPRGELSHAILAALARDPHPLRSPDVPMPADPLADEDLQLALYGVMVAASMGRGCPPARPRNPAAF